MQSTSNTPAWVRVVNIAITDLASEKESRLIHVKFDLSDPKLRLIISLF